MQHRANTMSALLQAALQVGCALQAEDSKLCKENGQGMAGLNTHGVVGMGLGGKVQSIVLEGF